MDSSFLLLLLLLIPSLKMAVSILNIITPLIAALASWISSLIFTAAACLLLSLLRSLKLSADALQSALQLLADATRSILVYVLQILLAAMNSSVFGFVEFLKNSALGLAVETGSSVGGLVEKTKTSAAGFEEVAEALRSIVTYVLAMVLEIVSSWIPSLVEFARSSSWGWVVETGLAVLGLVEKTKASLRGLVMEEVREIVEKLFQMIADMVVGYFLK